MSTAVRVPQEERTRAMRQRLLDATVECLVEFGWSGTSTTLVSQRAGVSRGAQLHHFPTKAELVSEAVRHLAAKRVEEFLQTMPRLPRGGERRVSYILDRVWEIHTSPLFVAAIELWVAARTDPELRAGLVSVEQQVTGTISSVGPVLFPERANEPEFMADIETAMSAIRGLALLRFVDDEVNVERRWRRMKRRLQELFRAEAGTAPRSAA